MTDEQLSSRHLYEQLAERIRHRILNGTLNPGDKLPAEHILAQDYGVSRTVVVDDTDQAFVQSLHLLMSLNLNDNMADAVVLRGLLEVGMATLARATQNAVIPLLIYSNVDLLQRSRSRTALMDGSLERGQGHHKQIRHAIRQGDAAGAQKAMQLHLEQVRRDSKAVPAQQT